MSEDKAAKLAYFAALEERMLQLLEPLRNELPKDDVDFVAELIDVHELGLGLEVLSNVLFEKNVPLDPPTIDEIGRLVQTMGLEAEVVDQLRRRVRP
jgi:hypothetical protein